MHLVFIWNSRYLIPPSRVLKRTFVRLWGDVSFQAMDAGDNLGEHPSVARKLV
jgi:hypothetical protein